MSVYQKRNYYGIYRIVDRQGIRLLYNGTTLHGAQSLRQDDTTAQFMYYDRTSPIAEMMTTDLFNFRRIGVVGLGAGIVAKYTTADQILDFYELDPDVHTMADQFFTYTNDSVGKINYIYGDARLSLDQNMSERYDLLLVDAFGGDAIPVHLLTTEMIERYRNHLNEQGILMFHISNRYLRLSPILARGAYQSDANVCYKFGENPAFPGVITTWIVMTWDDYGFKKLTSDLQWNRFDTKIVKKYRPWTDQYSTVLPIIKVEELIRSVKNFNLFSW